MESKMIQLLLMWGLVVICSANQQCNIICGDDDDDSVSPPTPKPKTKPTPTFGNLIRGKAGPKGDKGEPAEPCEFIRLFEEVRDEIATIKTQLAKHESVAGNLRNEIEQMTNNGASMAEIINRNRMTLCGVGIQDFTVRDDQFTASSHANANANGDYGPRRARLFGTGGGGHWIPRQNRANEWIQVDLERDVTIVGVVTQGCLLDYNEYVTSYNILYRADGSANLQPITDDSGNAMIFTGNTDDDAPLLHDFPQPVTARYFRLNILTWHSKIALRFDLLVC